MTLSFIIPVYNGADYIVRCLDSICNLELQQNDYEVIVVDDCSTDNTRDIVYEYMSSHSQVRILCQKENHKQGAARNRGLREAKGEYITYVDSDDIVLDGIVSALQWTTRLKTDMVYCSCYHEKSTVEDVLKRIDMPENTILSGKDFCEQYQQEGVFWYPWGFLIRREWLLQLSHPFVEDRQHEDRDWLAYVLSHARSVCNSVSPMYRYVCNPLSTCRKLRYSTVFDHVASGIRHIDLSKELADSCPNLSHTLYVFGVDEIYRSLRLRHLTKFSWKDNKNLYDSQHLLPLLYDLKRTCCENKMPREVRIVVFCPCITKTITFIASPVASIVRKIKHK